MYDAINELIRLSKQGWWANGVLPIMTTVHDQVWVKVNAQVDRGVAGLVLALSRFTGLVTIESCEDVHGWAWVAFAYAEDEGASWERLSSFVLGFLGPPLIKEFGDRVSIEVRLTERGTYLAEIAVRPPTIPAVIGVLKKLC